MDTNPDIFVVDTNPDIFVVDTNPDIFVVDTNPDIFAVDTNPDIFIVKTGKIKLLKIGSELEKVHLILTFVNFTMFYYWNFDLGWSILISYP